MSEDKLVKVHCNQCRYSTNHRVLKSITDSGNDDEAGFWWQTTHTMLQCCGCDEVVLRRRFLFSEDLPNEEVSYFPPPASRWLPPWHWSLPSPLHSLMQELYRALQADSLTLAMMGSRALIDQAIVRKIGDKGTFKDNLQALEAAGHLSRTNRKYLEAAFDAGSAAAHRAHRPDADQVNTVMDIVENLLQSLFVLEKHTKKLEAATPQRPAIKNKTTQPHT
jgi:Domain of unknown function (DUF4145)